jgi:hypothetical protein
MRRRVALVLLGSSLVAASAVAQAPLAPDQPLPPGHPPLEAPGAAPPPAGPDQPHAQHGEPEPDEAGPATHIPRGSIEARIVDADGKPLGGTEVRLGILYQTIAEGERRSERRARADGQGIVRFSGLEGGSAHSYRVTVAAGPATYAAPPITLHPEMGHFVLLHVYPIVQDIESALVGISSFIYIEPRDDVFQFEAMYRIFNIGKVTFVPRDLTLQLPEGVKAITAQESMSDVRFIPVDGGVRLEGTIGPGQHDVGFRFQLTNEHDETRHIRISLPPRVAEARVLVEASRGMELRVDGFGAAEPTTNQNGERVLATSRQLTRGEEPMAELLIALTGIPTPGPGRWYALVIALGFAGAGIASAAARRDGARRQALAPEDRVAAQKILIDELVRLEAAHARGDVGPRTYAEARRVLLDALARLQPEPGAAGEREVARRRRAKASPASV